jgi:HEAT repeat protein
VWLSAILVSSVPVSAQTQGEEVAILIRELRNESEAVRQTAASALAQVDKESLTKGLPLLKEALRDRNDFVRRIAAWVLANITPERAREAVLALENALADSDFRVRSVAASSVGSIGRGAIADAVRALRRAVYDKNLFVRVTAAESLGEIGPPAADGVTDLAAVAKEPERLLRSAAVTALGKIGRGPAAPNVIKVLKFTLKDGDALVRFSAAEAIGHIGSQAELALTDLRESVQDPNALVRQAAIKALAKIAHTGVEEARAGLVEALQSPRTDVRLIAVESFWRFGVSVKGASPLIQKLLTDSQAEIRRSAATTLGGVRPAAPELVAALKKALGDQNSSVREAAATALGRMRTDAKDAISALQLSLQDSQAEVRRAAVIALESITPGTPDIVTAVKARLADESASVRQAAVWALFRMGKPPPDSLPSLLRMLDDAEPETRRGAVLLLRRMGPAAKEAVVPLTKLLSDAQEQIRSDATDTLGEIGLGAAEAVPALTEKLLDRREKENVRQAAARSLGKIGISAKGAMGALRETMRDENQGISSSSAQALARVVPAVEIVPALIVDLNSAEVSLQRAALTALSSMGSNAKDAVPTLIETLSNPNEDISNYAASALRQIGLAAKHAIPALTEALRDSKKRSSAAEALASIATALQDAGSTDAIQDLEVAYDTLAALNNVGSESRDKVRRAIGDLKRQRRINLFGGWEPIITIAAAVAALNVGLTLLAIPWPWARRVILHPIGSKIVGLIVGKYLLIDGLIRFVRPIRMGLFQDYRRHLRNAPVMQTWENGLYISQSIQICELTPGQSHDDSEDWKTVLQNLLKRPTGRLWLLAGKSGLGKTALLERWLYQSLQLDQTPLFIPLGSDLSPGQEAAAAMAQYGDIDVTPDAALHFLKEGRFVILLDGFNEDRQPGATREFVRQVVKRNHVIMSTQFDPQWQKVVDISHITLKPFGRRQLLEMLEKHWVDELLPAGHLTDLAELPHTAQLLATYIKDNQRIPTLRLDIYRNLRKKLESDTQVLNLEEIAWNLFKENRKLFRPDVNISKSFCDSAVDHGILTKTGDDYQFRHELIHRFFVASYLYRQDPKPLEEWYREVKRGLGRSYWSDTLELLSEMHGERTDRNPAAAELYYGFLKEAAAFNPQIFGERLYPQLERLYRAGLKKDAQFIEWSASCLARAAAAPQPGN